MPYWLSLLLQTLVFVAVIVVLAVVFIPRITNPISRTRATVAIGLLVADHLIGFVFSLMLPATFAAVTAPVFGAISLGHTVLSGLLFVATLGLLLSAAAAPKVTATPYGVQATPPDGAQTIPPYGSAGSQSGSLTHADSAGAGYGSGQPIGAPESTAWGTQTQTQPGSENSH